LAIGTGRDNHVKPGRDHYEVGEYSRVGAGSVVLKPVPPGCTVVGVPARVVGCAGSDRPSQTMNQIIESLEPDLRS
jgi:serine O-acetyltransferase